jgi:hypothetical protein
MKLFLQLYPHSACGQILILEKSEKTITHNPDTLCHSSKKPSLKAAPVKKTCPASRGIDFPRGRVVKLFNTV